MDRFRYSDDLVDDSLQSDFFVGIVQLGNFCGNYFFV